MKKVSKKLLAALLAATMLLTAVPAAAFADEYEAEEPAVETVIDEATEDVPEETVEEPAAQDEAEITEEAPADVVEAGEAEEEEILSAIDNTDNALSYEIETPAEELSKYNICTYKANYYLQQLYNKVGTSSLSVSKNTVTTTIKRNGTNKLRFTITDTISSTSSQTETMYCDISFSSSSTSGTVKYTGLTVKHAWSSSRYVTGSASWNVDTLTDSTTYSWSLNFTHSVDNTSTNIKTANSNFNSLAQTLLNHIDYILYTNLKINISDIGFSSYNEPLASYHTDSDFDDNYICKYCGKHLFKDVSTTGWYLNAVNFAYYNGIVNGTSADTFSPNSNVTRAQFAAMLYKDWRSNNQTVPSTETAYKATFSDIPSGKWYTEAVMWASYNGIITGYSNGKFGPNDNITREMIAVIFYRYESWGYKKGVNVYPFGSNPEDYLSTTKIKSASDYSSISKWARTGMAFATNFGVINGSTNSSGKTVLNPKGTATRAQAVTMIYNFYK